MVDIKKAIVIRENSLNVALGRIEPTKHLFLQVIWASKTEKVLRTLAIKVIFIFSCLCN